MKLHTYTHKHAHMSTKGLPYVDTCPYRKVDLTWKISNESQCEITSKGKMFEVEIWMKIEI
jgi:hypothetical protein